ncbi:hypothetical protein ABW19_dt0203391 [Dactylella cylindrospora]|nr:hypothetical protein ABW19_dt0203391 [Dactylella cylindrospora]
MSTTPPRPGSTEPISSASSVAHEPDGEPTRLEPVENTEGTESGLELETGPKENVYEPNIGVNLVASTDVPDDDEQPVTTSVPKELSPVSPVPLHVPEPSSIPLLLDPALSRTIPNEEQIPADIGSALNDPSLTGSNIHVEEATIGGSTEQTDAINADATGAKTVEPTEDQLMPVTEPGEIQNPFAIEHSAVPPTDLNITDPNIAGILPVHSEIAVEPFPGANLNERAAISEPTSATQPVNLQALLANLANQGQVAVSEQNPAIHHDIMGVIPSDQTHVANTSQAIVSPSASLQPAPSFPNVNTTHPSLPPPPVQPSPTSINQPANLRHPLPENPTTVPFDDAEAEVPFTPDEEKSYQAFLKVEHDYVAKGEWGRFPVGSRLFIGNLSSERVDKRDIYRVFAKYGKLAQISIKQAFGFVQFFDVSSCTRALRDEQGTAVRGRKMHLEISKPQRNNRNNEPQVNNRTNQTRRSRSPEEPISPRNRGSSYRGPAFGDRDRESRNSRDNGMRGSRDEYRPSDRRMSSPRSEYGRDREDYYPRNYRNRSRSPRGRYRTPTPPGRGSFDNHRPPPAPSQGIDALIVVFDELDHGYIKYVDGTFKDRRLRTDVLHITPRIHLESYIKRQILEGCQAVVFLTRQTQDARKVSVQIFKGDGSNAGQYDEYDMVNPDAAAELVLRACSSRSSQYNPPNPYPNAPYQAQQPPAMIPQAQPNLYSPISAPQPAALPSAPLSAANLTGILQALDPATLQGLLAQLQAQQQQPGAAATANPYMQAAAQPIQKQADLSALLGAATRGQAPQQMFGGMPGVPGYQNPAALVSMLGALNQQPRPAQPQQQQQPQHNQQVQNIMSQLTGQWSGGR